MSPTPVPIDYDGIKSKDPIEILRSKIRSASYSAFGEGMDTERLFRRLDKDNSGYLELKEFIYSLRHVFRVTESAISNAQMKAIFSILDDDGDGVVSASELANIIEHGGRGQKLHSVEKNDAEGVHIPAQNFRLSQRRSNAEFVLRPDSSSSNLNIPSSIFENESDRLDQWQNAEGVETKHGGEKAIDHAAEDVVEGAGGDLLLDGQKSEVELPLDDATERHRKLSSRREGEEWAAEEVVEGAEGDLQLDRQTFEVDLALDDSTDRHRELSSCCEGAQGAAEKVTKGVEIELPLDVAHDEGALDLPRKGALGLQCEGDEGLDGLLGMEDAF